MNSNRKGKVGELEFSKLLNSFGIKARRGQQYSGGDDSPDVIHGLENVHFEVKRTEKLELNNAIAQAKADCGTKIPIIAYRKNRGKWICIFEFSDFIDCLIKYKSLAIYFEIKESASFHLHKNMHNAVEKAGDRIPVVLFSKKEVSFCALYTKHLIPMLN